ncbi:MULTISPECIES: hypothetical protein [unclassified Carboxylicivirga]|uniref:hypothetical protein n=1 Tax=Carboxylicivirga TaxID=1628153 RepID=UPI003D3549B1
MKKIIICSLSAIIFMVLPGCFDSEEEILLPSAKKGAVIPVIENVTSSFYDLNDLDNSYVEFTVVLKEGDTASEIIVQGSYNGQGERVEVFKSSDFPASIYITADNITSALGIDKNSLALGDVFNYEVLVTANGQTTRSSVAINASVACESDLSGTYLCIANGQSTDPGPTPDENPAVDFESIVTLTEGDINGEYTISDFSGGLFTYWYDIYGLSGEYPGFLKDVCGGLSYFNTTGPFGSPISGTGSVDPETGVITISGVADLWGDNWVLVLTPQ